MNYQTYTDRLHYLKELLFRGQVRSPREIAARWGCSERTIRNMINRLREKGLKIKYSRSCRKYFLEEN